MSFRLIILSVMIPLKITRTEPFSREYKYKIIVGDESEGIDSIVEGWVNIDIRIVGHNDILAIYPLLKAQGVSDDDKMFFISKFYPLQSYTVDHCPYLRQGIGTQVLNRIIKDALHERVRVIDLHTSRTRMKSFVAKHGFTHYRGHKGDHYYKLVW